MNQTGPEKLTDRKHAAILKAAATLFQQESFDRTSMDRIAEAAKVSKRTVYNHFPSKEALFQAIVDLLMDQATIPSSLEYHHDAPLKPQLAAICRTYIGQITSDEFMKLSRVVLSRFLQSPELAESTVQRQDEISAGLVTWLHKAEDDGRLQLDNPELAVELLTGMIKNSAFWPQAIACQPPLPDEELTPLIDTAVDLFLARYAVS